MIDLNELNRFRVRALELQIYGVTGDATCGVFAVPVKSGALRIIAAVGGGWDHLSVSHTKRTPMWIEMEQVKRMFFKRDECAMQLHPPPSDYINCHPNVLHIWRPHNVEIPMPPKEFV